MTRSLLASVVLALALPLAGCSGVDGGTSDGERASPTPSAGATSGSTPSPGVTATPTPEAPPHPVSLPALAAQEPDGGDLRLGRVVLRTATQTQYDVTWRGGDLTLTGRLAVPTGAGPHPGIVLAHGYIDPAVYTTGQGMTRERAWLADRGYVVLHVDYRNHAGSSRDPDADVELRLGYTDDVVSAILALRAWQGPIDRDRLAVGGRSMGGGVVYNVLATRPGLVDAGVVWAPVSSLAADNFERWVRRDPGRSGVAGEILRRYGDPRSTDPEVQRFWREASPRSYLGDVTEPVMVHHGTLDDSCPIAWSHARVAAMRQAGVDVTLHVYEGEGHAFGQQFVASMERTAAFLERHLA